MAGLAAAVVAALVACPAPAPPTVRRAPPPDPATRPAAPRPLVPALATARRYVLRPPGLGAPRAVALSADGRRLALSTHFGGVHLVDLTSGKTRELASAEDELDEPVSLGFTPDGRLLVAAGFDDRELRLFDVATGRLLREVPLGQAVNDVAVAGRFAVVGLSNRAELRGLPGGALERALPMPYGLAVRQVAASADGRRVALCSAAGHLQIFDLARGYAVANRQLSESPVTALAFPPRGPGLLVGLENGRIRLLDAALKPNRDFAGPDLGEPVAGLAAPAGDGPWLALRTSGELLFLHRASGKVLARRAHGRPLQSFTADGRGQHVAAVEPGRAAFLLQAAGAGTPLALPTAPPAPLPPPRPTLRLGTPTFHPLPEAAQPLASWAMAPTGSPVVLGLHPPALEAWTWLRGPKPRWMRSWRRALPAPPRGSTRRLRVALAGRGLLGTTVFLHGPTDQLRRFRARGGFPLAMMPTRAQGLRSLLPTPDGKLLVTTTATTTVHLFTALGVAKGRFEGLENPYWVAISPDGALFAEVAGVDDLGVFALPGGKHLWSRSHRPLRKREVLAIRFDPASRELHSVHRTGFLRVHAARTGKRLRLVRTPLPAGVTTCDLRPDLRVLACAAAGRLHLLELPSGAPLGTIDLPAQSRAQARAGSRAEAIWGVSFLEDGKGLMIQRGPRHLLLLKLP